MPTQQQHAQALVAQIRALILQRQQTREPEEAVRLAAQIDALRRELATCG